MVTGDVVLRLALAAVIAKSNQESSALLGALFFLTRRKIFRQRRLMPIR